MKPYIPTVAESLECADSWANNRSCSNMAVFRRVGVVLAGEVRRLEGELAALKHVSETQIHEERNRP